MRLSIFLNKSPAVLPPNTLKLSPISAKANKNPYNEPNIPIKFIGTGESIDDIEIFDKKVFVESFFQNKIIWDQDRQSEIRLI